MKVTNKQIEQFCKFMNYKLLDIGKIAFAYRKEDGTMSSLLKAGACSYKFHECPTCEVVWKHGCDGFHSCSGNLEQDAKRWRGLMSSERIRFIGSARLGKKTGQLLCVEFHSNIDENFKFKISKETELSQGKLEKYTDTLIKTHST